MRLKKEHIDRIAELILAQLKAKNLVKLRSPDKTILAKMIQIITQDLMGEDDLERKARDLLDQYRPQIQSGQLDERRAIQMIKAKLAKEKKMVL